MTGVATAEATTPASPAVAPTRRPPYVALVVCLSAIGCLLCVVANALSRATESQSSLLFWAGVLLIVLPTIYRLSAAEASNRERLFLVCLLGMALYAVKLARDPFMFTYPDELVHAYNALNIVRSGELFDANPILAATPSYPGLEGATAALMSTGGWSVFSAGVVIVAMARLLAMVALFFLFLALSHSPRTAGLGAAVYAANANFLYFNAQYSYESLALPLLVGVLTAVAFWRRTKSRSWAAVIVLGTGAVVVTHHLTSYALAAALTALSLLQFALRRRSPAPNPWPFALVAVACAAAWLVSVGSEVVDYLRPVFERAAEGVQATIEGDTAPRQLFEARPGPGAEAPAPPGERIASVTSVPLLGLLVLGGLYQLRRQKDLRPFAVLLSLAALAYFGTLALRLTPEAWEVGNRASAFLFVGVGFVVGCSGVERWAPRRLPVAGRALITACLGFAVIGGAVAGWPAATRLSQPLVVKAEGRRIESEPLAMARWLSDMLPGQRFAATVGDARLALVHGRVTVFAGANPDVQDMLFATKLDPWMRKLLRDHDIRYVITDRRFRATQPGLAPHFVVRPASDEIVLLYESLTKFEKGGGARVFDSGNIAIFDMRARP